MKPRDVPGRYRSGQTGQTVNLLALRLRWFESSPAQTLIIKDLRRESALSRAIHCYGLATIDTDKSR
jgi:hypothetical protein